MRTKSILYFAVLVAFAVFTLNSCDKDDDPQLSDPVIVFTSSVQNGKTIMINVKAAQEDRERVWIDLNNNHEKDASEAVTVFGKEESYTVGVAPGTNITLHGKITEIRFGTFMVTSIDVSKNPMLERLQCFNNQIKTLDVTKNRELIEIGCYGNEITVLDVSKNPKLTDLWCEHNKLTALDLSQNKGLIRLSCYNNNIKGEAMTVLVNSLPERTSAEDAKLWLVGLKNESNKATKSDVNIAKGKKWKVWNENNVDYPGN